MKDYGKTECGTGKDPAPAPKPGYSAWIESGIWYTAPAFTSEGYRKHDYMVKGAFDSGVRDCRCGCWMLSSSSGGPVDPFGRCPEKPKPK